MFLISIEHLYKDYKTGSVVVNALKDIDLTIAAGSFLSIAGPSGSGKTTLLNMLGCLDKPSSGGLRFESASVSEMNERRLSDFRNRHIGFIFQDFNLIPVLTVYENVRFSLEIHPEIKNGYRERIEDILFKVGILDLKDRFPRELSGGQKQRVAIARALVKNPSTVLADEPTANLDSENAKNIMELMRNINKEMKTTFIFSTHDPMVMDYAERIVRLHDGKIVEDSSK